MVLPLCDTERIKQYPGDINGGYIPLQVVFISLAQGEPQSTSLGVLDQDFESVSPTRGKPQAMF